MQEPEVEAFVIPNKLKMTRTVAESFREVARSLYDGPLSSDDDLITAMTAMGVLPEGADCSILEVEDDDVYETTEAREICCDFCGVAAVIPAGTMLPSEKKEKPKYFCGDCLRVSGEVS